MQDPGGGDQLSEEEKEKAGLAGRARDLQNRPRDRETEQNREEKTSETGLVVRREKMRPGQRCCGAGERSAHLQDDAERGRNRAEPDCPEECPLHSAGRSPPGP